MRIKLTSVLVDDQDKALHFYTDVLGFRKTTDGALCSRADLIEGGLRRPV